MSTLTELAMKHGTDKWSQGHRYTPHYERHFSAFVSREIRVLEIGIGGRGDPNLGGESLRMWKEYFPNALIFGLDIHDKSPHDEPRIKTIQGDQGDAALLADVNEVYGPFDIVIDDGSHINGQQINSFIALFPLLKMGGIYAIEDLQTSYWPDGTFGIQWGGNDAVPRDHNAVSAINFLKWLVDCLNWAERIDYVPKYFDKNITAISFYPNLCFITKGPNEEPSNWVPAAGA